MNAETIPSLPVEHGEAVSQKAIVALVGDVKTVQTIMCHSDIRLTIERCDHLFPGSEAAAFESMRGVFAKPAELRKTGTSDRQQLGRETVRNRAMNLHLRTLRQKTQIPLLSLGKTQKNKGIRLRGSGGS